MTSIIEFDRDTSAVSFQHYNDASGRGKAASRYSGQETAAVAPLARNGLDARAFWLLAY